METIFKHAWIMFIGVTILNALILKSRSKKYIAENHELEPGYEKLFKGLIFYGNIPWLIIAVGNLSGLSNTFLDYLHPRLMNPIVLVFHASIVVLWILNVYWIFFRNGAEFLARHPGLFKNQGMGGGDLTAKQIKLFFPLMLLGGLVGMIVLWVVNVPEIKF